MAEKCNGVWGWLFGHSYLPIYETEYLGTIDPKVIEEINTNTVIQTTEGELTEALSQIRQRKTTYIHTICKRCGNKITRE
jgi:hypothetical protein